MNGGKKKERIRGKKNRVGREEREEGRSLMAFI
jgi:hypothetical protein